MWTRAVSVFALSATAFAFAPQIAMAGATPGDLCGWSGNVTPLMAKADTQVTKDNVTAKVKAYYGKNAEITTYTRMEVDLLGNPATTKPTDPRTLTDNRVTYNLQVTYGTDSEATASVQMRYDGLCKRTAVFKPGPWVGSTGTDKNLKVNAKQALRLAQEYRKAHSDTYPLDYPLFSMNLMQSTTAPPDFGKLRWYVNYDNGAGGLEILAVYMDGTVSPTG